MEKQLLNLGEKKELSIVSKKVPKVDTQYDFSEKKLASKLNGEEEDAFTYIISPALANAVNAAIITGRPLLLKGEPGCGKTQLAKAVAYHFFEEDLFYNYFEWHIKSSSKATDGTYQFDHVNRLRESTIKDNNKEEDLAEFTTLGPMGKSFVVSSNKGYSPILLIDEIDKGDLDFPNDLLLELDEMRFKINEFEKEENYENYISAEKRPLVFITSNNEKDLPPAFLRRCLYFEIPSFGPEFLNEIVNSKLKRIYKELDAQKKLTEEQASEIITKFLELKENKTLAKLPSTSELIDWIKLIIYTLNEAEKKATNITLTEIIEDKKLQELALKLI